MSGSSWLTGMVAAVGLTFAVLGFRATRKEEEVQQQHQAHADRPEHAHRQDEQRRREAALSRNRQQQQEEAEEQEQQRRRAEWLRCHHLRQRARESEDTEAVLPIGWSIAYHSNGRVYYHPAASGAATWDIPSAAYARTLIALRTTAAAEDEESEEEPGREEEEAEEEDQEDEYTDDDDTGSPSDDIPPCPVALLLAADIDFKGRTLPSCDWCGQVGPRVQCGRCLDAFYCNGDHQQEGWSNGHHSACNSFVDAIAEKIDFSVDAMHTKLRPRRGSIVDPYSAWTFNVFARFYCDVCEGPRKSKGKGKASRLKWASARSAMDLSLDDLCIVRVYKQQCKRCGADALPVIARDELIDKVASLLRWFRDLHPSERHDRPDDADEKQTPPHLAQFCEKCEYGRNPHTH